MSRPCWSTSKIPSAAAVVAAFGALAMGCAGSPESPETVGQVIQPIIHGEASGTEHDAVVVLTNFRDGLRRNLCSATLVAPNMIITARHCVSDTESSSACTDQGTALTGAGVKADRPPENLVVFVGKNGVVPDTEVEENGTARGAKIVVGDSKTICNADIAFLILDRKVDAPIAPIRLAPPSPDEKVSAVGWGVDETGKLPPQREVRRDIPLIGIGPGLYPENPNFGYGDSEFMIGESACSGDSGGPALSKAGAVVGVASRAGNGKPRDPNNYASTCMGPTAHAVYTHLGAHKDLVLRAFQEAGEPMWLEGEPDPRAPKPQANESLPDEAGENTKKTAQEELPLPDDDDAESSTPAAGGCSVSSEPQKGAVEYAAGVVALLATLFGLRRRFGRRKADEAMLADEEDELHRPRMPSMP